jgi:uncharacterized protein (DUF885 family)
LDISSEELATLEAKLILSLENSVTPGFILLRDFMVLTRDKANPNHGIWSQPNGDEFYKLRIRTYTTTDYSPQKIHDMNK